MTKRHLRIDDLSHNAAAELTEDDVQKITGGVLPIASATPPQAAKTPGPPAPFVPVPLPNIGTYRTK